MRLTLNLSRPDQPEQSLKTTTREGFFVETKPIPGGGSHVLIKSAIGRTIAEYRLIEGDGLKLYVEPS